MRKMLFLSILFPGMIVLSLPPAHALQVNFDSFALHSWGRLYDIVPSPPGPPDPAPMSGLDPVNPGHSLDNPYNPIANNPTQGFTRNVYAGPDGTEDRWGIIGMDKVMDSMGNAVRQPAAGKEWAMFFWGGDDVMVTVNDPRLGSAVYSQGVKIELWETGQPAGTYSASTVGQGTGGRSNPADQTFYNQITDGGGTRLLTLEGHTVFIDRDSDGIFDPTVDDTNGDGLPDLYDLVSLSLPPAFRPPFVFVGSMLLDVVSGLGDLWEPDFDTNGIPDMQGAFADFSFSTQSFDNRPSAGGPGNGNNPLEFDDVWTLFDQPFIQGNLAEAVPEPATILLLGAGLIGVAAYARRFRKQE